MISVDIKCKSLILKPKSKMFRSVPKDVMVRFLSKWWKTSKMDIPQFTNNSALSLGEETSPFKMQKEMEKVYDQFIE